MRRGSPIRSYRGTYHRGDRHAVIDVLESKETPPRHRAAKDTRRWCAGVIGREHEIGEWSGVRYGFLVWRETRSCIKCGKVFAVAWCKDGRRHIAWDRRPK